MKNVVLICKYDVKETAKSLGEIVKNKISLLLRRRPTNLTRNLESKSF